MENQKIYIKHIPSELGISRTKLFELFKLYELKTQKEGRRGYITPQQYKDLKEKIELSKQSDQSEPFKTQNSTNQAENQETIKILIEQFDKERAEMKAELQAERDEKTKIAYQLGQAQTEHQHTKKELLRLQEITQPEPDEKTEVLKKPWWQVWK